MTFITRNNFEVCSNALQATALDATSLAASSLPSDLAFHRSMDQSLAHDLDSLSTRVLELTNRMIQLSSKDNAQNFGRLEDEDDVVDEFSRNIVDAMEGMLERTDSALDEFLGRKKPPAIQVPSTLPDFRHNKELKTRALPRGKLDPTITHASHLPKPQLRFRYLHPNTDESPYIPVSLIPHKWCAKVPLGYVFEDKSSKSEESIQNEEDEEEETKKRTLHPYYYELTHPTYPVHIFNPPSNPVRPSSLDMSPSRSSTFVANSKDFLSFANTLSSVTELAVDLEHHSYRSYRGFLALMQVSTRQEDFIIDLLVPDIREGLRQSNRKPPAKSEDERTANEAGEIVARVFADPSVVKVFHGADSDIVWLQQDFNIFVVGLFDTFHASKLLEFPKHSLANLLETYCDFVPDKRYQLADWRIRPLPIEMSTYAQSDTHFLLYVYDRLRLALVDKAMSQFPSDSPPELTSTVTGSETDPYMLVRAVLARSARTSLRLYEVEAYDALEGSGSGGWDTLARKWNKVALTALGGLDCGNNGNGTTSVPVAVYRAVHRWREDVAREEDESTRYVLPTHHLFLMAERPPSSVSNLVSLFDRAGGGSGVVPPVLRRRMGELISAVKSAIDSVAITPKQSTELEVSETATGEVSTDVSATIQHTGNDKITEVIPTDIESRLWTMSASSCSVASGSILFPSAQGKTSTRLETAVYTAPHSMLLGDTSRIIASRCSKSALIPNASDRFRDIADRIHRTLVIAPVISVPTTVPTVESTIPDNTPKPLNATPFDSGKSTPALCEPAGQIEIPFVPEHQRQSRSSVHVYTPMEDDTIVVVGQAGARQRKRKREKNRGTISQLRSGSGATVDDQEAEVETFDYSSVPNLLDEGSQKERTSEDNDRKNKKQRKSKAAVQTNIRAGPRDQREVKSGNKTHTFK